MALTEAERKRVLAALDVLDREAAQVEEAAKERGEAIVRGDRDLLEAAKAHRGMAYANDLVFWGEAERGAVKARGEEVAPAKEWRRDGGDVVSALATGGDLAKRGVKPETIWDGPFDLTWATEAMRDGEPGFVAPEGLEIMRTADPTGELRNIVVVGSCAEGIARAQFGAEEAKHAVFVAYRADPTPALNARLARVIGGITGSRARLRPGMAVEVATEATVAGIAKAKAVRLCVPAGVACEPHIPPAGRKTWLEALGVMAVGQTAGRERSKGQGRELGLGGPGKST